VPRVERITAEHEVDTFSSGNESLDSWLVVSGLDSDRAGTARVYLWLDEMVVLGYFAIAPHVVRRDTTPPSVGRGAPEVIPAVLLARLALAERAHGIGKGGELLSDALRFSLEAIRVGGGRLIVVDAIDQNAHDFYEHFGFRPAVGSPGRLVMKASSAAASLGVKWP
jgi:GNAT superfamily N-acetyltransferase